MDRRVATHQYVPITHDVNIKPGAKSHMYFASVCNSRLLVKTFIWVVAYSKYRFARSTMLPKTHDMVPRLLHVYVIINFDDAVEYCKRHSFISEEN